MSAPTRPIFASATRWLPSEPMASSSDRRSGGAMGWLVLGCLFVGLFAIGSVDDATLGLTAFVVVATAAWMSTRGARTLGPASKTASYALWLATLVSTLQLLPLPLPLLRLLDPRTAQTWAQMDDLFARTAHFHPLTLDPPATIFGAITSAVVALFFDVCARLSLDSSRRERLLQGIGVLVALFAVTAIVQRFLGVTRIFGVYTPVQGTVADLPVIAPLVNPNHAAAVTGVGLPVLVGLGLDDKRLGQRIAWWTGAVTCGAVTILTLSRSGMGVVALSSVGLAFVTATRRGSRATRAALGGGIGVLGLVAAGVAIYAEKEGVLREARNSDVSKFNIVVHSWSLIRDHLWLGVGRSAFSSTFSAYDAPIDGNVRFEYVENWPMQICADYGVPIAALLTTLLAFAIVRGAREARRRTLGLCVLVALAGLAVHDLADFSMSFAGVGMLAAALLAYVTSADAPRHSSRGRAPPEEGDDDEAAEHADEKKADSAPAREGRSTSSGGDGRPWIVRLALIAIVTPIALAWRYGRDAGDEGRSLAHRWSEDGPASLGNAIAGAASRHPADPYFYMVEGVRQFNRRENPGRFLIEALRLGPGRAATHYWLARLFLASDNRGQAWPEYREALRRWPPMLQPVLHDMLHADAPVEEILQVIVDEKQLDDAGQTLLANGRESDALVVDDLLIERFPPALNARSRRIQREVRKDDVDGARRLARDLIALAPGSAVGFDALASLVSDPHLAELILETGLRTAPDDLVLLRSIARRKGARLGVAAIAPELEKLRRLASEHQGNLCDVTAILAYIAVDQNHGADALGYFEQAAAESDNGIRYLDEAARLAERNGQRSLAARLWRKIADVSGDAGANTHARDLEESIEKGAREQELGVPGSPP